MRNSGFIKRPSLIAIVHGRYLITIVYLFGRAVVNFDATLIGRLIMQINLGKIKHELPASFN